MTDKINNKEITLTNQNRTKQLDETIRIHSNNLQLAPGSGQILTTGYNVYCFLLVEKLV